MTQTNRKYLTFFIVLLAVAISSVLGSRYLESVHKLVMERAQNKKAPETDKIPEAPQKPMN